MVVGLKIMAEQEAAERRKWNVIEARILRSTSFSSPPLHAQEFIPNYSPSATSTYILTVLIFSATTG